MEILYLQEEMLFFIQTKSKKAIIKKFKRNKNFVKKNNL